MFTFVPHPQLNLISFQQQIKANLILYGTATPVQNRICMQVRYWTEASPHLQAKT